MMKRIMIVALIMSFTMLPALADQFGLATFYENPYHGGFIAAHRTLPFGTRVLVHNLDSGRSATVTIVDRGPFAGRNRIIDVSTVTARSLGMIRAGIAHVRITILN
jgi:rare lipoprotein A